MAGNHDSDPTRAFLGLLREAVVKPIEVARVLDDMSHAERVTAVRSAGRAEQRRLYEAVAGFRELRMTDMVGPSVAAMKPVRHYGKNTLPAFSHFEKRFCRPADADANAPTQLWGYNEGSMRWLTGPATSCCAPTRARRATRRLQPGAAGASARVAGDPPQRGGSLAPRVRLHDRSPARRLAARDDRIGGAQGQRPRLLVRALPRVVA